MDESLKGPERMRQLAALGGRATLARYGPEHYAWVASYRQSKRGGRPRLPPGESRRDRDKAARAERRAAREAARAARLAAAAGAQPPVGGATPSETEVR